MAMMQGSNKPKKGDKPMGGPGKRTFTFPFKKVLAAATRLGQFDLTEEELLDKWWRPRYEGYGKAIGVEFNISDMDENGKVTITLAD